MSLQATACAVVEACNIGAERALAAREGLPVIGEVGEIHPDHQRPLVDVDETGLGPHSRQRTGRIDRATHRAVARLGGRFVECGGGVPQHALAGAPAGRVPERGSDHPARPGDPPHLRHHQLGLREDRGQHQHR